jgi:hypothetical protein
MDWHTFEITRIDRFRGCTVGSLNPSELQGLVLWMAKVQERWKQADDGLKRHFAALLLRMRETGMLWNLLPGIVLPDLCQRSLQTGQQLSK